MSAKQELTVEQILNAWQSQSHVCRVTPAQRAFIAAMRVARAMGVGFGWMQQVIEWEWRYELSALGQSPESAWGPLAYERERRSRT